MTGTGKRIGFDRLMRREVQRLKDKALGEYRDLLASALMATEAELKRRERKGKRK